MSRYTNSEEELDVLLKDSRRAKKIGSLTCKCISKLPPKINILESLTALYLWSNDLKEIPIEMCDLIHLEYLDIGRNKLV